jgi:dipeptidyl aminopeptidase
MPQHYDPLSQEEDDGIIGDAEADNGDSFQTGLLPRPAIYYGEGPFNAPSSDEEEEVEKVGMGQLDRAEHGSLLGSGLADSGLYVGGRKVSTGYAYSHAHEVARVINDIIMAPSPPLPL